MTNETKIEKLLRQAPRPGVPPGLHERLQQRISLPQAPAQSPRGWWATFRQRPWTPALALFAFLAVTVAVLAVQSNHLARLAGANEQLRTENARIEELVRETAQPPQLGRAAQQFESMRKQHLEVQQLRAEIEGIQTLLERAETLEADRRRLRAELDAVGGREELLIEELLAQAKMRAERIKCVNHLKQIGLAARIWATDQREDHRAPGGVFPSNYLSMTNELVTPKLLVCPSDHGRQLAETFEQFGSVHASYEMLSPGITETQHQAVFVRCPIHNNVTLVDGSVHQLGPDRQVVFKGGVWVVDQNVPPGVPPVADFE